MKGIFTNAMDLTKNEAEGKSRGYDMENMGKDWGLENLAMMRNRKRTR